MGNIIGFIIFIIGFFIAMCILALRNRSIINKVESKWLTTTNVNVIKVEKSREVTTGNVTTIYYTVYAEYFIDDNIYQIEEVVKEDDLVKLDSMKVFYNPSDFTQYVTEIGLHSSIINIRKAVVSNIREDKEGITDKTQRKVETLSDVYIKFYKGILAVFIIPFILGFFAFTHATFKNIVLANIKYDIAVDSWIKTSAVVINIDTVTDLDDEDNESTKYIAYGEYVVDNKSYSCSKVISNSDEESSFEIYYNPKNFAEYAVQPQYSKVSIIPMIFIIVIWLVILSGLISSKLNNPIKLVYLCILNGGNLVILICDLINF